MELAIRPVTFQVAPAAEILLPRLTLPWRKTLEDAILRAGSKSFYLSQKFLDEVLGATAYAAPATIYGGLWTSALDDTSHGATAGEAAYTSYARLALTNNTTIFATGSGTTTYTKTFPSDAAKTWATSTGSTATCTYLGFFDGNAGTSADKLLMWCTITSVTVNSGDTPRLAQNAVTAVED